MSFRRMRPSDSLDLLLDTMCNAFGGIILMAVLLALLNNHQRQNASLASTDSVEILQRRIAMAETHLASSRQIQSQLLASTRDEKLKERLRLIQEQRQLQSQLSAAQQQADNNQDAAAVRPVSDPAQRLKQIQDEMAATVARRVEQENALNTAEANIQRLRARLADLGRQIAATQGAAVQKLRLPRERRTTKAVYNVIVQYGLVYPLKSPPSEVNRTSIDWTFHANSATPRPKPGLGIDPVRNTAALRGLFRQLSGANDYVGFYVFDDSFDAFNKAKQVAIECGLDYGWEPQRAKSGPLSFGTSGTSPLVQ